jgi:hypothetical protein
VLSFAIAITITILPSEFTEMSLQTWIWAKIILLCIPLSIWFLSRWKGDPYSESGEVRLRYNPPTRILTLLAFILSPVLPVVFSMALIGEQMRGEKPMPVWATTTMFAVSLAFIGAGFYYWRETRFGFLSISPEGMEYHSPWTGITSLPWTTVVDLQVNAKGAITLKGADGTKLKLDPTQWAGMDTIREAITRNLS